MGIRNKYTFVKGYKHSEATLAKMRLHSTKGRNLKDQIVIHHINGNHFDDRPENRMVVTRSEHIEIHRLRGDLKSGRSKIDN